MNFKEFLKKKSWPEVYKGKAVYVKDLGEWAWEQFANKRRILDFTKNGFMFKVGKHGAEYRSKKHWAYRIAVACLGEKEIEKRLKGLKNA